MDFSALSSSGRAKEIPSLVDERREEYIDADSDDKLNNLREISELTKDYNRGKLRMEDAVMSLAHLNGVSRDQISPIVTDMLAVTMLSASHSLTYTSVVYVMAPGGRSHHSLTGSTPSTRDAAETASPSHVASQASDPSIVHTPSTASSSTSRRGRGPTRGLVLQRLTHEGRVTVEFPQDCLRPVGDNARLFTSEVGVLCRSLIPTTTPRWVDVTDDVRQHIRQRLTDKFVLDLSVPYISHAVDDMIKERFKEYRSDLHQWYKRCRSLEEAVLTAPPHVTIDDWRILCERFSSESFQVIFTYLRYLKVTIKFVINNNVL
ncbi:uncharacterized protein LOC131230569 [Magnolia sinica]|uniref:uncharacterized protein LOC131230569 n=1 Tax=Magnolia sinica TaxID=86752 RepID=UPI002659756A|nr:uncharacterized protein LOC131230569 [Magnolia sinica]